MQNDTDMKITSLREVGGMLLEIRQDTPPFVVCNTPTNVATKEIAVPEIDTLQDKQRIFVRFKNKLIPIDRNGIYLKINDGTPHPLTINNIDPLVIDIYSSCTIVEQGATVTLVFDAVNKAWCIEGGCFSEKSANSIHSDMASFAQDIPDETITFDKLSNDVKMLISKGIPFAVCNTAEDNPVKKITITSFTGDDSEWNDGMVVAIRFTHPLGGINCNQNLILELNGVSDTILPDGAHSYSADVYGNAVLSNAGEVVLLVFNNYSDDEGNDRIYWSCMGKSNSTIVSELAKRGLLGFSYDSNLGALNIETENISHLNVAPVTNFTDEVHVKNSTLYLDQNSELYLNQNSNIYITGTFEGRTAIEAYDMLRCGGHYGVCSTEANNPNKVIIFEHSFVPQAGDRIVVKFEYGLRGCSTQSTTNPIYFNMNGANVPVSLNGCDVVDEQLNFTLTDIGGILSFVYDDNNSNFTNGVWIYDGAQYIYHANQSDRAFLSDGVINGVITMDSLADDVKDAINLAAVDLGNKDIISTPFTLAPTKIGTWIDGTPVWRMAFEYTFHDYFENNPQEYTYMLDDLSITVRLPIVNPNNVKVLNLQGARTYIRLPSIVDDVPMTRESGVGDGLNLVLPEYPPLPPAYEDLDDEGVYGYVEFATPMNNIDGTSYILGDIRIITDSISISKTFNLESNTEYRFTNTNFEFIEIETPVTDPEVGSDTFEASVVFLCGSDNFSFSLFDEVSIEGKDCIDGVFYPTDGTAYDISIWYNGISWKAVVV